MAESLQSGAGKPSTGPGPGPIERAMPPRLRPFVALARLDHPIGVWLLLWPCLWAIALASDGLPDIGLLALFTAGAFVMRAAGCTLNDIFDRDFDARVERTRSRPLPSGAIGVRGAVAFMAVLLGAGLAILLQLNLFAILLGAGSLLLVVVYPLMKRITYWPQAFLGLTFNYGALLGWAAVAGGIGWPAGLLYAGGIAWTLGYDTIYAHQDKEDDLLVGVKSSALALGPRTRPFLIAFYVVAVAGFAGAGVAAAGRLALLCGRSRGGAPARLAGAAGAHRQPGRLPRQVQEQQPGRPRALRRHPRRQGDWLSPTPPLPRSRRRRRAAPVPAATPCARAAPPRRRRPPG